MLNQLSERIEKIDFKKSYLKHKNSDDARIVYFIRRLADHNIRFFGQPLYEVVSIITSVIFDLEISKERARDTIKHVLAAWGKTEEF